MTPTASNNQALLDQAGTHVLVFEPDSAHELQVYGDALTQAFPSLNVHLAHDLDAAMNAPPSHVVVAKSIYLTQALIDRQTDLAWVHSLISGEDHLRGLTYPTHPALTATRGVHSAQVSELAVMLMMALARDLPGFLKAQDTQDWTHRAQPTLAGRSAVIVGLGRIAEHLAHVLTAFGMTVDGVSNGRSDLGTIRKIYPRDKIANAVAQADFVIALVPLEAGTKGMFDQNVFAAMKPSAFFINVARGGVADEGALVDALKSGAIAGAGVDTFSTEPLTEGDPLWTAPNVILTPHVGGRSDRYAELCAPLLISNITAFLEGRADDMPYRVRL